MNLRPGEFKGTEQDIGKEVDREDQLKKFLQKKLKEYLELKPFDSKEYSHLSHYQYRSPQIIEYAERTGPFLNAMASAIVEAVGMSKEIPVYGNNIGVDYILRSFALGDKACEAFMKSEPGVKLINNLFRVVALLALQKLKEKP